MGEGKVGEGGDEKATMSKDRYSLRIHNPYTIPIIDYDILPHFESVCYQVRTRVLYRARALYVVLEDGDGGRAGSFETRS